MLKRTPCVRSGFIAAHDVQCSFAMSAGPFKIATVLLLAALPVALFGALSHGETRVTHRAARTASPVPATLQVEACDSLKPVVGESLSGSRALPTCNGTAPDPSPGHREVWAGGPAVDLGDSR